MPFAVLLALAALDSAGYSIIAPVVPEIGDATGARYEDTLRDDDLPGEPGDVQHSWAGLMQYDYVTMITGLGGTPTELKKVTLTGLAPDSANYPQ